ncbi:MAG TPA: hypothetical protein VGI19_07520 [Candidatus Cybelea sp.]|jgi:hypothetical protein
MNSLQRALVATVAAVLAIVGSAGAGMARGYALPMPARSYGGNWPVTVTGSHGFTGCLELTGSGSASVTIGGQKYTGGSYFVANDLLVATISVEGYGQNAGMVFIGRADRDKIGKGAYDEVYGGAPFVIGALEFGMKNGC